MRILEVETFGRGGLLHYTFNLSRALAERGHDVTLVTAAAYELEGMSLPPNVAVIKAIARFTHTTGRAWPAPAASLARKLEALADAYRAAALARRLRPDVVHLHCTNPVALAYLSLLRQLAVPVVATAHVVTPHEPIPLQDAVYRRIHGASHLIIAHSDFDRNRLIDEFAVDPSRVHVIPHGEYGFFAQGKELPGRAEARRSFGLEPHDEVVLFFGYIRHYKGLDVLLEAWPRVVGSRPRARLLIAGDPVRLDHASRRELESHATRLGAIHRFEFIPFSDVGRYFAAADVVAMPYRHISQSGVLLLALALGVPVVATRVGALPEILRDGDSALLVAPESPSELAGALLRVLGDMELRGRLARGGRRVADTLSWASIAERTESAFAGLQRDLGPPGCRRLNT